MSRTKRRIGIGVDVGGTYTKIAAVTDEGKMVRVVQIETRTQAGPQDFTHRVVRSINQIQRSTRASFSAGGIGLAGDVDSKRGLLRFTPNMKPFGGVPFKSIFEKRLKVPFRVDNDANVAAWGGYIVELRRRVPNVVVITLGTGVGGGIIVDGRLHQGSTGSAAEIGHTCVEPDGEKCNCGNRGCLEAYVGSYGIVRTVQKMIAGMDKPERTALVKLCPDLTKLNPCLVAQAAKRGDRIAKSAWRVTGYYLGIGIANAVRLLNPDVVLLTGGVSRAGGLVLSPALAFLKTRAMRTAFRHVRVQIASTQNLGAIGAALWGLEL